MCKHVNYNIFATRRFIQIIYQTFNQTNTLICPSTCTILNNISHGPIKLEKKTKNKHEPFDGDT